MRAFLRMGGLALTLFATWGCAPSIHDVVGREDIALTEAMLAQDPALVHARNALGKTPLHYAVTYGAAELVEVLLRRGANVNDADSTGLTPLHVAAMLNRTEEARMLLAAGADLEARDSFGDTPLHLAALHGQVDMLRLLVSNGADTRTRNHRGIAPLEAAQQNRKETAVAFLTALNAATQ